MIKYDKLPCTLKKVVDPLTWFLKSNLSLVETRNNGHWVAGIRQFDWHEAQNLMTPNLYYLRNLKPSSNNCGMLWEVVSSLGLVWYLLWRILLPKEWSYCLAKAVHSLTIISSANCHSVLTLSATLLRQGWHWWAVHLFLHRMTGIKTMTSGGKFCVVQPTHPWFWCLHYVWHRCVFWV